MRSSNTIIIVISALLIIFAWPHDVNSQEFELVGSYDSLAYAENVTTDSNFAYVSDHALGLVIFDISDPSQPLYLGRYDSPYFVFDANVIGDRAYIAAGSSEPYIGMFYIIDIYDKANPFLVGSLNLGTTEATAITTDGIYWAYVANGSSIRVIQYAEPENPALENTIYTTNWVSDIYWDYQNELLFATIGSGGLLIYDVDDRIEPPLLGSCETPGMTHGVALDNLNRSYAYVADGDSGMQVINYYNRQNPYIVASYRTSDAVLGIDVNGSFAYLAVADSGVEVVNISNPLNPTRVASANTVSRARGICWDDYHVFVAAEEALEIYAYDTFDCTYVPGDINNSGRANGIDVTYGVYFFKGGSAPPIACDCFPHGSMYVAGDVNGNCVFNGIDLVYYVWALWGIYPIRYCPDCPPRR